MRLHLHSLWTTRFTITTLSILLKRSRAVCNNTRWNKHKKVLTTTSGLFLIWRQQLQYKESRVISRWGGTAIFWKSNRGIGMWFFRPTRTVGCEWQLQTSCHGDRKLYCRFDFTQLCLARSIRLVYRWGTFAEHHSQSDGMPGQSISDIQEVHSHPMALLQCKQFFHAYPHIKLVKVQTLQLSRKKSETTNK